ncbi:MAG TPA: energy transducer TonB [Candidatus Krumholzibacterium sp.]|nr:energy transducer TonB [Candidatus Krumholzibacterium sp.]
MNAYALSLEMKNQQSRTRKIGGVSLLIHALLLLLLLIHKTAGPEIVTLTEISWIDPEPVVPVAAAPAVTKRNPVQRAVPSPAQQAEHFVRKTEKSDIAPQPQKETALKDRLNRKLASLEQTTQRDRPKIATLAASSISNRPALAAVPDRTDNSSGQVALERNERPVASPVNLARSDKRTPTAQVMLSTIPEKTIKPATVARADSTARRMIDGMSLVGPVADRSLVGYGMPGYPDWAKVEGIEGSVDLYFIVLPNGSVKENILVQRTSGFEDFDKNAIDALLAWKFEPLEGGRTGEQWGAITFDYRLSD